MDARNRKLRTGLLVAILIVSAFAVFPIASAANATVVRSLDHTNGQGPYFENITAYAGTAAPNTNPNINGSGVFAYGANTKITVSNITASGTYFKSPDHYDLWDPQGDLVASADTSKDLSYPGHHALNVTFGGVLFNQTGNWTLDPECSDGSYMTFYGANTCSPTTYKELFFYVGPKNDMTVTVTPSTLKFPDSHAQIFSVKVTDTASGSVISGAKVYFVNNTGQKFCQTTGADGMASCTVNFQNLGVGSYTIKALKSTTGTPAPERIGSATVKVTPNKLDLDLKTEQPIIGFTSTNSYQLSYPGKNTSSPLNPSDLNTHNWTVTVMNGAHPLVTLHSNDTGLTKTGFDGGGANDTSKISVNASGVLNITDRWTKNAYKFIVHVNWSGSNASEYTFSRAFAAVKPANVNVQIKPQQVNVEKLSAGDRTFQLTITGNKETIHPGQKGGTFGLANITISGDYVGVPVLAGSGYNSGSGMLNITGIRPSQGGGKITFTVTWRGTTSTKVSIINGAVSSVSPAAVTVQHPTKVTVHVEDVYGNPVPDSNVSFFWANGTHNPFQGVPGNNLTALTVHGTGAPNKGQGGNYVATINSSHIGKIWAIATIGHGSASNYNYTYTQFSIVPAHDLNATAAPASSLAGYDTTFTVNVTRAGSPFLGDYINDSVWFLNSAEWSAFQANGTLPAADWGLAAMDSTGNYSGDFTFAAGTYHVYVRSDGMLHDNLGDVPTVTVSAVNSSYTPAVLITKVVQNGTIEVMVTDLSGNPLNGTLAVNDSMGNATYYSPSPGTISVADSNGGSSVSVKTNMTDIPVVNGMANLTNITSEHAGWIHVYFKGDGASDVYAPVGQDLQIKPPHVTISPDVIYVGETNRITVTVTNPNTGAPLENMTVTVAGGGVTSVTGTTNAAGQTTLSIFPLTGGKVTVFVNGEKAGSFTPVAGLSIQFDKAEYLTGDNVTVTVIPRGSIGGEAGVQIYVDGVLAGATGANGQVVFQTTAAGTHTVKAVKAGFANATNQFTVKTKPTTPPPCTASFQVTNLAISPVATTLTVGTTYTVSATVTNTAACSGTIQLEFQVGGITTQVQTYQFAAHGSKNLGFTWTPSQPGDSITVGINGVTHTVKVTKKSTSTGVPGFTTVGALAAMGAALVLLQRRRRL